MALTSFFVNTVKKLSPGQCVAIFTFINILNYLDRGIVPGAFDSIGDFIRDDLHTDDTDTQIGLLQSMYIVGYAVASVSFGHLVHKYPPFHLMSLGLAIWVFAVILSGWAPHFWVLVLARVLSGAGEASFQTVVPPYIDDHAPPAKRGMWLALFFSAIPVGTAVGYGWGGNIASSSLTWRWAFFLEAFPMIPLIFIVWFIPYNPGGHSHPPHAHAHAQGVAQAAAGGGRGTVKSEFTRELGLGDVGEGGLHGTAGSKEEDAAGMERTADGGVVVGVTPSRGQGRKAGGGSMTGGFSTPPPPQPAPSSAALVRGAGTAAAGAGDSGLDVDAELAMALGGGEGGEGEDGEGSGEDIIPGGGISFFGELVSVLTEPIYMSIVLGYAGYTAVLAGMGSFGPTITKGLGIFTDQSSASLYFGGAVATAGALGTPLGGWMLDYGSRRREKWLKAQARARAVAEEKEEGELAEEGGEAAGAVHGGQKRAAEGSVNESSDAATADAKMLVALPQAVWATALGTALMMPGIMVGKASGGLFFTLLGSGALALCTTTAGINQSIMAAVRPESRSFAIGMGTLLLHAFGDVPAPPVIGAIADRLSPQTCTPGGSGLGTGSTRVGLLLANHAALAQSISASLQRTAESIGYPPSSSPPALHAPALALAPLTATSSSAVSEGVVQAPSGSTGGAQMMISDMQPLLRDCTRDAGGLQITLVITLAWLIWPILLWGAAWFLVARRAAAREKAEGGGEMVKGPSLGAQLASSLGFGGRRASDGGHEDHALSEGTTSLLSADRSSVAKGTSTARPGLKGGYIGRAALGVEESPAPAGSQQGASSLDAYPPRPSRDWDGRVVLAGRGSFGALEMREM